MKIPFATLKKEFKRVLLNLLFTEEKAELCADIFASNSRDGIYSHGLNRFPLFVNYVKEKAIDIKAEPELIEQNGLIEIWDGHLAPGMYNATKAMDRAIILAKSKGIGCVAMRNTTHWMRGGTYGWQAADAGCIGICFTNTIANMPPWGGKEPRLGNNPLVIAVPRDNGHIVLDMAMSQFSYGKLQEYESKEMDLPVTGGYDKDGNLSSNPTEIIQSQRPLPIGFWKGSGLSFILDVLLTAITGGQSTARVSSNVEESGTSEFLRPNSKVKELGISQFFLALYQSDFNQHLIEEIIQYTKSSAPVEPNGRITYPGENTLATRKLNELNGIPVKDEIWAEVLKM